MKYIEYLFINEGKINGRDLKYNVEKIKQKE